MKVLILGSEGFIGSHLVRFFLKKEYSVFGCDLYECSRSGTYTYFKVSRLSPEWEGIFSSNTFDYCINASGTGSVPFSMTHPFTDFESNALDVIRILDNIRRLMPGCRYLHISSAAVYGNPRNLPVREEDVLHPLSPYGWHKLVSEQICREYHEIFGVAIVIVRPFSVYGSGLNKQLLWDVCKKLQLEDKVTLYGTGKESRDFIHVEDLCALLDIIIHKSSFTLEVYNAANGQQVTIENIVGLLHSSFECDKEMCFNGNQRAGDPLNWEADTTKIIALGYRPAITLEQGIQEYVQYFKGQSLQQ
jgi:UDP-glucose 4-epimerase